MHILVWLLPVFQYLSNQVLSRDALEKEIANYVLGKSFVNIVFHKITQLSLRELKRPCVP